MNINKNNILTPDSICDPSLIHQINLAVDIEQLPPQFTLSDIKEWMKRENIMNLDGTAYPEISLELLTNYSECTPVTRRRKQKVLYMDLTGQVFSFYPFS